MNNFYEECLREFLYFRILARTSGGQLDILTEFPKVEKKQERRKKGRHY